MKKLLCLIFISIFLFSCKSNEDPKPTTLAERTGTYEGGGYTVIISSEGEIQVIQNSLQVGFDMFDANSRAEDFNVGTYKVELDNDPEINDTPLSKINNTGTIRLTLEKRVGVYENKEHGGTVSLILNTNGTAKFTPPAKIEQTVTVGNPLSTDTYFSFNYNTENWNMNFETLTLVTTDTSYPTSVRTLIMIKQ